jgi:hypothetical protein
MDDAPEVKNLEGVLEEIQSAGEGEAVSIADIQERLGRRSFGPLLLVASVVLMTPLVNIPGLPTIMGVVILLTSLQMLIGRPAIWLPRPIRARSVRRDRVEKAVAFALRPARLIDRLIRPRLAFLTAPPMVYVVALCCAALGAVMPPLEFVPGTSAIPAIPVAILALGLTARDGVLIILGLAALIAALAGVAAIGAMVL